MARAIDLLSKEPYQVLCLNTCCESNDAVPGLFFEERSYCGTKRIPKGFFWKVSLEFSEVGRTQCVFFDTLDVGFVPNSLWPLLPSDGACPWVSLWFFPKSKYKTKYKQVKYEKSTHHFMYFFQNFLSKSSICFCLRFEKTLTKTKKSFCVFKDFFDFCVYFLSLSMSFYTLTRLWSLLIK